MIPTFRPGLITRTPSRPASASLGPFSTTITSSTGSCSSASTIPSSFLGASVVRIAVTPVTAAECIPR